MDNKKVYSISINGISESAIAVESLNKQLDDLEKRIKELGSKNIKIDGGSIDNSAIKEQVAAQKELNQLKKEEAAQQRLVADEYANTMKGMKQNLADLKTVINATDLGDSDSIKKMTHDANELNNKLKDIEQSYGQFGRNVGNYANGVAEGLKAVVVNVGGVDREFKNAREASRTLGNELKAMAINGEQSTKAFKDMQKAVAKLNSDIKDATVSSKAMDNLLDTMQSFASIGAVTQGFSALFGFDDDEIQKSIQKLVALQNVMQGIEKINQQINSQEGIGSWLAKGNQAIDSFVAKITGAAKAQDTLTTATKASEVASKGLATAEEAQAVATNTATVATKGLSLALKAIGIGLVISAIATLITYWEDIYDWFTETIPALKNLSTWFDKIRAVAVGVGTAIINYMVQPLATLVKVIQAIINGNFSDIPNIIGEGMKKTFDVVGNYQKGFNKETERQQKVHNDKMLKEQKKTNEEWLKDEEAKNGKSLKLTQDYVKKQQALIDKQLKNTKKDSKEYKQLMQERRELQRQLWDAERTEREKNQKKAEKDNKEYQKKVLDADKELVRLRIEAMKEGLRKTITQLEEERKAKIAKVRADGVMVSELEAQINATYDKKIEDARREHVKEVANIERSMYDELIAQRISYENRIIDIIRTSNEQKEKELENGSNQLFNQNISSYGIQGKNQYSPSTQESLGIISTVKDEMVDDYKELMNIMREFSLTENALKSVTLRNNNELEEANEHLVKVEKETNEKLKQLEEERASMSEEEYEKRKYDIEKTLDFEKQYVTSLGEQYQRDYELDKMAFDGKKKLLDDYNAYLAEKYSTEEQQAQADYVFNQLLLENYTESLVSTFDQRISAVETYWKARIYNTKIGAKAEYETSMAALEAQKEQELRTLENNLQKQIDTQEKWFKKKLDLINYDHESKKLTEEEYNSQYKKLQDDYQKASLTSEAIYREEKEAIIKKYQQQEVTLEQQKNEKLKQENAEYYQDTLQEFRDFQTALSNLESKQPVMNKLGFINMKETNKNNRELLASYEELARQVSMKRNQITKDFQGGIIDKSVYESSIREMDSFVANLGEKMDEVKQKLSFSSQFQTVASDINQYMQMLGNSLNSMLSSLADYQDQLAQNAIDALEEEIEKQEDLLNKQKEIVEEHKNAIDSIEDELATARGSRRQHLIDQLNAQMEAERSELAEQKRIEKEKQRLEAKKDTEEKKRNRQQQKIAATQAIISGALAVSNALAVQPFWVGIAMAAMAAAASAMQIATINAQKFASGGVIQGKSHAQGGVKVLGGQAEVEGGEYITNKITTSKNVDLLEYINDKHRKLNIDDFIDFYSSGKVKKAFLSASPRHKYADGGVIPTLDNEYSFDDRLLTAFEKYSERPTVVSVVDINSRQAAVKNVQVLAGLGD